MDFVGFNVASERQNVRVQDAVRFMPETAGDEGQGGRQEPAEKRCASR